MKKFVTLVGLSILLLGAGPSSGQEGVEGGVIGGPVDGIDSGYDRPPKAIKITRPQYPKDALEKRIEGTVVLTIVIDVKGHVVSTQTVSSVPGLDEAAIDCVKQWEFKPAVKKGHPVAAIARAPITFRAPATPTKASPTPPPAPSGARGIPSGTTQRLGTLSFDPQGADFTAWLGHFRVEVYNNWIIPKPAELGYRGQVDFKFVVERDGGVSSIRMLSSSGTPAFDLAAKNALTRGRFLSLPSDYGLPRVTVGVTFSYAGPQETPGVKPMPAPSPATTPKPADEGRAPAEVPGPAREAPEWTTMDNGCTTVQKGSVLHISGTTNQDGWNHWNGVMTKGDYPEGDFTASADFRVPLFKGAGTDEIPLVYLRVSSAGGDQIGIFFRPGGAGYRVQAWGPPRVFSPWLPRMGDEATAFHRMRLKYEAATKTATGWVDDRLIGSLQAPLTGRLQFWLAANANRAGMDVDLYFDNFSLTVDQR